LADWATISAVATAGGTLILAVATFASTRTANRAARVAEQSLLVGLRPALVPSRPTDVAEEVRWGDDHQIELPGGSGWAEVADGNVYLALAVRNVGAGLAVLRRYSLVAERAMASTPHGDPATFRRQQLDLYVPAGDTSYWQASLRNDDDGLRGRLRPAIERGETITVELLYTDQQGGQPTITRFALIPSGDGPEHRPRVMRHWTGVAVAPD
jgi:hypothetical protein